MDTSSVGHRNDALRDEARRLHAAAIAAVEPEQAVLRHLHVDDEALVLGDGTRVPLGRRVVLLGGGKAAVPMARAVRRLLGSRLSGGLVVTKHGHGQPVDGIEVWEAGHPVPDEAGLHAARHLLRRADALGPDDLAVVVLSGGGSALLPAPVDGLDLPELQRLTEQLLASGASIHDVNIVRRRLSRIAGGGLARHIAPARAVTLALSDVLGDAPEAIASGPTVPDPTSPADARAVLRRHGLAQAFPDLPLRPDLPTPVGPYRIVGSLALALDGVMGAARSRGWPVRLISDAWTGEARELGVAFARTLLATAGPCCLVAGGEPTVTLRGDGRGGRAQELALAAALELEGSDRVLLAGSTDGTDGPTDAAGALVDGETLSRTPGPPSQARAKACAHLNRNDSYTFLAATGDLLFTGPTRTNVGDIYIGLCPGPPDGDPPEDDAAGC